MHSVNICILSLGFYLLVFSNSYAQLMPVSCQGIFLEEASFSVHSTKKIDFERADCSQAAIKGQMLSAPSMVLKKYRVLGDQRRGVIQTQQGSKEFDYLDSQKTIMESEYHIPDCGDIAQKWRLQIGAVSDSNKVANEKFFHLIHAVTRRCGLTHQDMKNIRFCKTHRESFGHSQQRGQNTTSRLFAIIDDREPMQSEPAARAILVQSCRDKVENNKCEQGPVQQCEKQGFFGKMLHCMPEVQQELAANILLQESAENTRKLWIVPPKGILQENFTIIDNKYQYLTCHSFAISPSIQARDGK